MFLKNGINIGKAVLLANLCNKKTPVNVKFQITSRCNSGCKYCLTDRTRKEMSPDEVYDLLKQMANAGTQRIGFFGGEALLRKDFSRCVDFCIEKKIYVTLISNGYLVPKNINLIRKLNCLILSFDGPKRVHDENREAGSYDKVIKAIKIAVKHVPLITHTTLTDRNIDSIDEIVNIACKYGFYVTFCPVIPRNGIKISDEKLREAIQKLILWKKKGKPILLSYNILNYWLNWGNFSEPLRTYKTKSDPKCWAGKLFCEINSEGNISNCDSSFGFAKRNVLSEGFENAFQNLGDVDCRACIKTWDAEYNFMFSLYPASLYNWINYMRKNSTRIVA
jgi:MoaA/NifB/PqqE/SkfB family radical SAM enzyme